MYYRPKHEEHGRLHSDQPGAIAEQDQRNEDDDCLGCDREPPIHRDRIDQIHGKADDQDEDERKDENGHAADYAASDWPRVLLLNHALVFQTADHAVGAGTVIEIELPANIPIGE